MKLFWFSFLLFFAFDCVLWAQINRKTEFAYFCSIFILLWNLSSVFTAFRFDWSNQIEKRKQNCIARNEIEFETGIFLRIFQITHKNANHKICLKNVFVFLFNKKSNTLFRLISIFRLTFDFFCCWQWVFSLSSQALRCFDGDDFVVNFAVQSEQLSYVYFALTNWIHCTLCPIWHTCDWNDKQRHWRDLRRRN